MVGVVGAGAPPALPDLARAAWRTVLVRGVLPLHELFDDPEEPLPLLLLLLRGRKSSGSDEGSSTIWAKMTARAAARGRRAHQRCKVDGCPCRIDFSLADASLIA
jgi:hypothetical protein